MRDLIKETILKVLMENTKTEFRYVGGGDEPSIISFDCSEDCDKEIFLSDIATEIVIALDKNRMI